MVMARFAYSSVVGMHKNIVVDHHEAEHGSKRCDSFVRWILLWRSTGNPL